MRSQQPDSKAGNRRSRAAQSAFAPAIKGTAAAVGLVIAGTLAVMGSAQAISVGTTLFAPPNGVTAPIGGVILPATALSPVNGQPERHLWYADHVRGLCRMDPDLASPAPFAPALATCQSAGGLPVPYGPAVYDPATNFVYVADTGAKSLGIIRLHYNPAGNLGHGSFDPGQTLLGDAGTATCGIGGTKVTCPAFDG